MTYQIVVPIYKDLPHIEENIKSIADFEHLLIIDNSTDGFCKKFEDLGAQVRYFPHNIGVARAWNLGIAEGKDYTFFVSSSVKFNKGFKEVVDGLEELLAQEVDDQYDHETEQAIQGHHSGVEWGVFTQLGWHCNAISKKTVDKIGLFDENFYPAYYEDTDYCRRLYLAGLHPNLKGETLGGVIPTLTIDAKPIGIAVSVNQGGLQVDYSKLAEYYKSKWGGVPGEETSEKPFGCPLLRFWPRAGIEELKERYGL